MKAPKERNGRAERNQDMKEMAGPKTRTRKDGNTNNLSLINRLPKNAPPLVVLIVAYILLSENHRIRKPFVQTFLYHTAS